MDNVDSTTGSVPPQGTQEHEWTKADLERWLLRSRTYGDQIRLQTSRIPHDGTIRNGESWIEFDQLGSVRPYAPTFPFEGPYVDATHRGIAAAPLGRMGLPFLIDLGVDGYLNPPEALKLYEMVRLSKGDVLELGTFRGLSAMIMATALRERGSGHLHTVDIDPSSASIAEKMLAEKRLNTWVTPQTADARVALDQFISDSRRFGFIFVDHWHGYTATRDAIARLASVLDEGGFVLFHDFNDPDNADPGHAHKVYAAVMDSIALDDTFEFYGIFASAALFRKTSASSRQ